MVITNIKIDGYRNLQPLDIKPHQRVNIIYGDNAQGKTNFIEAIFLLTGQKSFRNAKDAELLAFGGSDAAVVVDFYAGGRDQQAVLSFGKKKAYTLNELPITPGELTGRFLAVVFSPTELALVKEGPAARRAFLDSAISQVMPRYSATLSQFNKVLYQRNKLLFDMKVNPGNTAMHSMLETWDISFARAAYPIINARNRYIKRLLPIASGIYSGIASGKEQMSLGYFCTQGEVLQILERAETETSEQSAVTVAGDVDAVCVDGVAAESAKVPKLTTTALCEQAILQRLAATRAEDIKNAHTTTGPHRDDLDIRISEVSARTFGSQGQQRSAALAIKLAECNLISDVTGEQPIILLDDVFSELDKKRKDYVIKNLTESQVFITSCDQTGIRKLDVGKAFNMRAGVLLQK